MGGMIFGYEIGVSGGVTTMAPFLAQFFPSELDLNKEMDGMDQSTGKRCMFSSPVLTLFTSSLYLAALVGSLLTAYTTRKFGRRYSLLIGGLIACSGAILSAAAMNIATLFMGRVLLGVGVGFAIQSVPVYISEMAPDKHRGSLNIMFQYIVTAGIFIANTVNYSMDKMGGNMGWRISLGYAIIPALIMTVSSIWVPETPNSVIEREKCEEANPLLQKAELYDLEIANGDARQVKQTWTNLLKKKYKPLLHLAEYIPAYQQFSGINIVMFYAPQIFKTIGFGHSESLLLTLIIATFNIVGTFISIWGVDRWGRRRLLIVGGCVMFFFQAALALLFGLKFGLSGANTELSLEYSYLMVACFCAFVFAFAFSWGPLGWLVPSEIFPKEIRSSGQTITVAVNMLYTFCIAQLFPTLFCGIKSFAFGWCAFNLIFITIFAFFVPETKNIPIEGVWQALRERSLWKGFVDDDGEVSHGSDVEKSEAFV